MHNKKQTILFTHGPSGSLHTKEANMTFSLRKTTITSVRRLIAKLYDSTFVEVVLEDDEGNIITDTPVLVLPNVDFDECNYDHCQWLMTEASNLSNDGYNLVAPFDEDPRDLLSDGQTIYVITNNPHNA